MPRIVDKEQKRTEIARKTMPLIAKYGYENTPIRLITTEAGIGKGTFYEYFSCKEDVLNEIIQLIFADWIKWVNNKIGNTGDPLKVLLSMLKDGTNLDPALEQNMIIYVDLWRWAVSYKGSDEFVPRFRHYLTNGRKAVIDIIRDAQNKGLVKMDIDPAAIAAVWLALIDGMSLHYMILKPEFDVNEISQSFWGSLLNGIKRT
jgi:AcrR family transcriptional regulator